MTKFIDAHKTAAYTGMSYDALAAWRMQGRGPAYIKAGRKVLYNVDDLDAFMAACRVETRDTADHQAAA